MYAYSRFRRALLTKNVTLIDAAARELQHVGLDDALRILVVLAERRDRRFGHAAARFAGRVTTQQRLSLAEARYVLALAEAPPALPRRHRAPAPGLLPRTAVALGRGVAALGLGQLTRLGQLSQPRRDRRALEPQCARHVARGGTGVRAQRARRAARAEHGRDGRPRPARDDAGAARLRGRCRACVARAIQRGERGLESRRLLGQPSKLAEPRVDVAADRCRSARP